MKLTFTRRLWRNCLIVGILAAFALWHSPLQAQNSRVYAMSPDGRIVYEQCNDELLVQFEPGLNAGEVLRLLAGEEAIARLKADEVLPSPKNLQESQQGVIHLALENSVEHFVLAFDR